MKWKTTTKKRTKNNILAINKFNQNLYTFNHSEDRELACGERFTASGSTSGPVKHFSALELYDPAKPPNFALSNASCALRFSVCICIYI